MAKTGQDKREENGFLNFSVYFSLRIQNKMWLLYKSHGKHMAEKTLSRRA